MHRLTYVGVLLLALLLTAQASGQTTPAPLPTDFDYAKAWAMVDSLDKEGLPQQARAVVDSIYAAALVFLWWLGIVRIAGGTLAPVRRRLTVALLVPILWLVTLVTLLLGIPWLTLYVVAIFFSLSG